MYKWKCTVCGEIVEGTEPPKTCPVCGVGSDKFVKIEDEVKKEIEKEVKGKTYKWKCTVCGEIIEGTEPPAKCPVCGVGSDKFVKLEEKSEGKKSFDSDDKFIVIGASGAGMSAVEEIRKRNSTCQITVYSKEDIKGYYRPQLSKMLSNDLDLDKLTIKDDEWFNKNNVKLVLNKEVASIDAENKKVLFTDGEEDTFTKLIIASGAEVNVPPFLGKDKEGVFTLRYIKDVNTIKEYAKDKKTAAVIGGGVLGLETASELNNLGLLVTVIEMADRILPRQLDNDASILLEDIVNNAGVNFKKAVGTKEILGDDKVKGILLDNGEMVDAEVVIMSTGVKANSKIAEKSNIEIKRAINVNNKMETSVPGIYACGDCAEFNGVNFALWSEAILQGKAAGINAVGGEYIYEQIVPSTTMNAFNSSIFSIGDIGSDKNVEYKVFERKNPDNNNYKKLYFKDGLLAGGMLIGDTQDTVNLIEGFEKKKTMEEMLEIIK